MGKKSEAVREFLTGIMDINSGVNRLSEAREGLKADIRFMVISILIAAVICIGIMYLRFRIFGR